MPTDGGPGRGAAAQSDRGHEHGNQDCPRRTFAFCQIASLLAHQGWTCLSDIHSLIVFGGGGGSGEHRLEEARLLVRRILGLLHDLGSASRRLLRREMLFVLLANRFVPSLILVTSDVDFAGVRLATV